MIVPTTKNGKRVYKIRYEKTGKLGNKVYYTRKAAERRIAIMHSYKGK
jgi:hypothetical protein